jgi:cysteine desulfurase
VIYLDNSATTRVRPEVLAAMLPYLTEKFGNASSVHQAGRVAREALDAARAQVAHFLGCEPGEIYFCAGGTMANNLAILGRARFVEANDLPRRLITSAIEHTSILGPCQYLQSKGWQVDFLPVNRQGIVELERLAELLQKPGSILSLMWANNEIGSIQPMENIGQLVEDCRSRQKTELFFHSDAVQAAGRLPMDMGNLPLSAATISGHKLGAPKGIGVLFLRRLANIMPIYFGGGQEMGLVPGTEALSQIVAMGEATRLAHEQRHELEEKLRGFQKTLLEALRQWPQVEITGPLSLWQRIPGHVSFAAKNMDGEGLVLKSDLRGFCLSSGSACHRGIIEPSHVLRALGLSEELAGGAVRIVFGVDNSLEDLEALLALLPSILKGPRK